MNAQLPSLSLYDLFQSFVINSEFNTTCVNGLLLILSRIVVFISYSFGVTDADPAPGPKETAEGEEALEVPPDLKEWTAEGGAYLVSESVMFRTFVNRNLLFSEPSQYNT